MGRLLIILFLTSTPILLWATHNRAGEITYVQIGPLTIRATITTYTQTSSVAADRDSLLLNWGDGTSEFVARSNGNGNGVPLANDTKFNIYIAEHTYPGRASYTLSFMDRNRVGGILNVNAPNSIEIPFYVETTFTFLSPQFQGFNSSAILLQPPVDIACVNQPFIHNPNAYDVDGDSLAYELGIPAMEEGMPVPLYVFPDQIAPAADNRISINEVTGDFIWDSPKLSGQYNIAIIIKEYRNGVLINSIVRDMQIRVDNCQCENVGNFPPIIEGPEEICVIAGETIDIDYLVNDPNLGELVEVTATGGPFLVDSAAVLTVPSVEPGPVPQTVNFRWKTTCNHISKFGYKIVIKAQDRFCNRVGLSTLKTVLIRVVGPPPQNLSSEVLSGDRILLNWDLPYSCETTDPEYFRGFSVWRKNGSETIEEDSCKGGLENTGYRRVAFLTTENDGINYIYEDLDVDRGETYCYRVLGEFAQFTATGQLFNFVSSQPSNETCELLSRDLPLIVEASVTNTDRANGQTQVSFIKPLANQLDTIMNPPPYRYELWRSVNLGLTYDLINEATQNSPLFTSDIDTQYQDINQNTVDNPLYYRVDLYSQSRFLGSSPDASTPFLSLTSGDQRISLDVAADVPWNNFAFDIFRSTDSGVSFDSITSVSMPNYDDLGLINETTYCYYIRTRGQYGLEDVPQPLINFSNIVCEAPMDNQPPCPPDLRVRSICDETTAIPDLTELRNTLIWNDPAVICQALDVDAYRIYWSNDLAQELTLLTEVSASTFTYLHDVEDRIAGCYEITAVDRNGNESQRSVRVCLDNCPDYILPNSFTPNDDNANDLFVPRVNRFIRSVDFKVFNRWGNLVWETTNPQLLWDGKDFNGNDLLEGVYFYTCTVERDILEIEDQPLELLRGEINLIR